MKKRKTRKKQRIIPSKNRRFWILDKGKVSSMALLVGIIALAGLGAIGSNVIHSSPASPTPTNNQNTPAGSPTPTSNNPYLQLKTFNVSLTPFPTSVVVPTITAQDCSPMQGNREEYMIMGLQPNTGSTIHTSDSIIVWVGDEGAPVTHGSATTGPNDQRTPSYPYAPSLYITALNASNANGPYSGDAEQGGRGYTPANIYGPTKAAGGVNPPPNTPSWIGHDTSKPIPIPQLPDPVLLLHGNIIGESTYVAEYKWNVSDLPLTSGNTYHMQLVVHDGDPLGHTYGNNYQPDIGFACLIYTYQ